jgi:hypothetical protein
VIIENVNSTWYGFHDLVLEWNMKRFVIILFGLLVLVIVTSASPVSVHGLGTSLSVEDASTHLNTVQVTIGSSFVIEDWIRGIPVGDGMDDFGFHLNWNMALMQYVNHVTNAPSGWTVTVDTTKVNSGVLEVSAVGLSPYGADREWLSVSFRCLATGSSTISISDSSWLEDVDGFTLNFDPISNATVSQIGSIPEYPLGLPLLAVFMVVGYGLIRRRTSSTKVLD